MTETEWLTSDAPLRLLSGLGESVTQRKLLLLACACTRQVGHLLEDVRSHEALAACEAVAEIPGIGITVGTYDEGNDALAVVTALQERVFRDPTFVVLRAREAAAVAVLTLRRYHGPELIRVIDNLVSNALRNEAFAREVSHDPHLLEWGESALERQERQQASLAALDASRVTEAARADLLRDIFGNPWHPEAIDPVWLAWNDGTVRRLAQTIHDERRFTAMNILADALLDAGCTRETIIAHCRSPKPHVRGCWVIDALLGKA
jgi:hypothetical protein